MKPSRLAYIWAGGFVACAFTASGTAPTAQFMTLAIVASFIAGLLDWNGT